MLHMHIYNLTVKYRYNKNKTRETEPRIVLIFTKQQKKSEEKKTYKTSHKYICLSCATQPSDDDYTIFSLDDIQSNL